MSNDFNQCKKCPMFIQHDVYPAVYDAENALIMPGICKGCLFDADYSEEDIKKIIEDLKYCITHGSVKYCLPCPEFKRYKDVEDSAEDDYRCADCENFAGFGVYPHRYDKNRAARDMGVCLESLKVMGYSDEEINDLVYELNIAFCDGNHIYPGECSLVREHGVDFVE